ncbi:MAG TPA: SUMF1/EgtB/PvdO family nonheme iron enzyme, partial [Isosphaeraceae bacterium]|nr:SUMF1/EgtB/PvdO family nonheme iron enzyme [Isosphaeraceae bacterium]
MKPSLPFLALALFFLCGTLALLGYTGLFGGGSPRDSGQSRSAASLLAGGENDPAACCSPNGNGRMPDPETAVAEDAGPVEETVLSRDPPPGPAPEGMVWVPGGTFSMGSTYTPFGDARPIHTVELDGFWMDKTLVTNEQFAKFVEAAKYITVAEQKPSAKDLPDVPEEKLVPGS